MRLIDEKYTETPFFGVARMTAWLRHDKGCAVNPKRVRRLMRVMGLDAIYPKPNLSRSNPGHKVFPYLLRGVAVVRRNQVWSTDITYIRLRTGFLYLVAIMDWFSRYVLSWQLSNTLENSFCIDALEKALDRYEAPEIFNTDQGAQFTSSSFTDRLIAREIKVSMDGRGRALDNVFIERLWRSVKYEAVYLADFATGLETFRGLDRYFRFYNGDRRHQSLGYLTPAEVYIGRKEPRNTDQNNGLSIVQAAPGSPAWN